LRPNGYGGITTPRIDSLRTRLESLERAEGFVVLDDGTKFKPQCSGIRLLRAHLLAERQLDGQREPILSDFTEDEQQQWMWYAKWTPDPGKHGAIAVMLSEIAHRLMSTA